MHVRFGGGSEETARKESSSKGKRALLLSYHLRVTGMKPFAPLAVVLYRGLGHRGLLHSLAGLGLLSAIALSFVQWWGWQPSFALVLGYGSHLAADAMTKSGIPLLYPSKKRYHLLPKGVRITTGSQAEDVLLPLLALVVLFLLLHHVPFMSTY